MSTHQGYDALAVPAITEYITARPLIHAGVKLHALSQEQTPPTDWETQLSDAQSLIYDGIAATNSLSGYYRARTLFVASPLFTLPALHETMEPTTLRAGLRQVQSSYVGLIDEISSTLKDQTYAKQHDGIYGLANELVCIAAMTDASTLVGLGRIALPALPWEDSPDTLRKIPGYSDQVLPGIDFKLMSVKGEPTHGVQVKSDHRNQNPAAKRGTKLCREAGVTVLYNDRLNRALTGVRNAQLFSAIANKSNNARDRTFSALRRLIGVEVAETMQQATA